MGYDSNGPFLRARPQSRISEPAVTSERCRRVAPIGDQVLAEMRFGSWSRVDLRRLNLGDLCVLLCGPLFRPAVRDFAQKLPKDRASGPSRNQALVQFCARPLPRFSQISESCSYPVLLSMAEQGLMASRRRARGIIRNPFKPLSVVVICNHKKRLACSSALIVCQNMKIQK